MASHSRYGRYLRSYMAGGYIKTGTGPRMSPVIYQTAYRGMPAFWRKVLADRDAAAAK